MSRVVKACLGMPHAFRLMPLSLILDCIFQQAVQPHHYIGYLCLSWAFLKLHRSVSTAIVKGLPEVVGEVVMAQTLGFDSYVELFLMFIGWQFFHSLFG